MAHYAHWTSNTSLRGSNVSGSRLILFMFTNLKLIFSQKKYIFGYIALVLFFGALWWYFTDIKLMFGNYGAVQASIDTAASIINIFLFSLFIIAWIFRSIMFGKLSHKGDSTGFLGGLIGVLISGSICCEYTCQIFPLRRARTKNSWNYYSSFWIIPTPQKSHHLPSKKTSLIQWGF